MHLTLKITVVWDLRHVVSWKLTDVSEVLSTVDILFIHKRVQKIHNNMTSSSVFVGGAEG